MMLKHIIEIYKRRMVETLIAESESNGLDKKQASEIVRKEIQ
jgi:hypothetical protein